ncbi:MAG: ATP-binding cassette domain-containing protein [Acidimicrobiales bacterium]
MTPALQVEGLGKIYGAGGPADVAGTGPDFGRVVSPSSGGVVAAWDVSFSVGAGEALGIIGESGSGKSTVLRCICGDQQPTVGSIRLGCVDDGATDLTALSPSARRALRVDRLAVVYQDPAEGLDFRLSAGGKVAERSPPPGGATSAGSGSGRPSFDAA